MSPTRHWTDNIKVNNETTILTAIDLCLQPLRQKSGVHWVMYTAQCLHELECASRDRPTLTQSEIFSIGSTFERVAQKTSHARHQRLWGGEDVFYRLTREFGRTFWAYQAWLCVSQLSPVHTAVQCRDLRPCKRRINIHFGFSRWQ